ncbi:hypothetical protein AMTRI_Chr07g77260 [Amborella trichopoda]
MAMYSNCGRIQHAVQVFDEMTVEDSVSYNVIIRGFGLNGFEEEALMVFNRMVGLGFSPCSFAVKSALQSSAELRYFREGMSIHGYVLRNGLVPETSVCNSLISMYAKWGRIDIAEKVFDNMGERDLVSWNAMISGFCQNGFGTEALGVFVSMKREKTWVFNEVTLLGLVQACGLSRNLDSGASLHAHLTGLGFLSNVWIKTSIMDMYAKCSRVDYATKVFEELHDKSLVSWNSLIAGYCQNGYEIEALELFHLMLQDTYLRPDCITMANVLPAYIGLGDLQLGQCIHGFIIKQGFDLNSDFVLATVIIDMYAKCLDIESGFELFMILDNPTLASWNAMIFGFVLNCQASDGLRLFNQMLQSGHMPDSVTVTAILQACSVLGSSRLGLSIHSFILRRNSMALSLCVSNALLDMYVKWGRLEIAKVLFNNMHEKNCVSYNTIIFGNAKVGLPIETFELFNEMRYENQHEQASIAIIGVLQACARSGDLRLGESIHTQVLKCGFQCDNFVTNSLMDMYAKCGSFNSAHHLFNQFGPVRETSSWNVMIAACGIHGYGKEACHLMENAENDGYVPDSITFVNLLSACSHSGLIKEGCKYFRIMIEKYGIHPSSEHLGCMVDMFSRAGKVEEAYEMMMEIGERLKLESAWGALLGGCRMNGKVEVGEIASEKLSRLAPQHCGYYALLSNTYAMAGRWDEVAKVRGVIGEMGLVKKPGFSTVKI